LIPEETLAAATKGATKDTTRHKLTATLNTLVPCTCTTSAPPSVVFYLMTPKPPGFFFAPLLIYPAPFRRSSMPPRSVLSPIDDRFAEFFKDLKLPEDMRDFMRVSPGPVLAGDELLAVAKEAELLVTVGDYCTMDLITRGRAPDIALVDFKTKRDEHVEYAGLLEKFGDVVMDVINPPGVITREAWLAIYEAFKLKKRVRLDIQGEEDLLSLVCVALAPLGAVVIYGLPGKGAVVVHVDKKEKGKMRSVFKKMVG